MTTMQRAIQTTNNPWSMFKIKLILPDQEYYICIQDEIKSVQAVVSLDSKVKFIQFYFVSFFLLTWNLN